MPRIPSVGAVIVVLVSGCLDPRAPGNLVPATVEQDPALPAFELRDGVKLHLETAGDPSLPVLILLHGGPGGDYRALRALDALSERYLLVYWDQRGAGLSQRVPGSQLLMSTYLADLNQLVDHFSPERKVTLVGHSFGGVLAAAYVNLYPQKVEQLALLDPAALTGGESNEEQVDFLAFWDQGVYEYLKYDNVASADDEELKDFRFFRVLEDLEHGLVQERRLWRAGITAAIGITDRLNRRGFNFTTNSEAFAPKVLLLAPPDGAGPFGITFQVLQSLLFKARELVLISESTHVSMLHAPQTLAELRRYLVGYR
jgi:pimeloyl-ACP methyl ester carboxylesterase